MNSQELNQENTEGNMHHEDIAKLWEKSQKNFVIEQLLAGKDLQEIIESLSGFKEAFSQELDEMDCSDERVPAKKGKKIGFAGQMILAEENEIDVFVNTYKKKIKSVASHDDCGAAGIKFEELRQNGKLPEGINNGDELGILHSKKMVEKLGAEWIHISKNEMSSDIHDARAICFDGTAKFNPVIIEKMPSHYVCSAPGFGLSKEYCQFELETLIGKVAFGKHAFGDYFTPEAPFYIFVSAYDQDRLDVLMEWARESVDEFGDRVEVKGFLVPK